ncbi:helix-turn-helix transcriptional regulator [Subtercola endophyticus]|uniref:helix-turn-helix transcriptional regulator n=1 Tax=Subtercola endophyticus TaxID=2895559 RepID=UPI001E632139|nr:LuxR C-terminal-related transcriptional regulator [Subtercola endophyticus]UFS60831.1 LuxR C-terminal-related transcriptional regulator [Subtercola endophyticus]
MIFVSKGFFFDGAKSCRLALPSERDPWPTKRRRDSTKVRRYHDAVKERAMNKRQPLASRENASQPSEDATLAWDPVLMADLLELHLRYLFADHFELTKRAIRMLPENILAERPTLSAARGFGLGTPRPTRTPNPSARTRTSSAQPDAVSDSTRDALHFDRMIKARLANDFEHAADIARTLRGKISKSPHYGLRPDRDMVAYCFLQIGLTALVAGDTRQAIVDLTEALYGYSVRGPGFTQRDAAATLACVHAAAGRLIVAKELLELTAEFPLPVGPPADHIRSAEATARALIAVEELDALANEALAALPSVDSDDELWPLQVLARTRYWVSRNAPANALTDIDSARSTHLAPRGSLASAVLLSGAADALITSGEPYAARTLLARWQAGENEYIDLARVRCAVHLDAAESANHQARALSIRCGASPNIRCEALLIAAWTHALATDECDSKRGSHALQLANREGIRRAFTAIPQDIREQMFRAVDLEFLAEIVTIPAVDRARKHHALSNKELAVLNHLRDRESYAAIAAALHLSENTVKVHVRNLYKKLGTHSRADTLVAATRLGIA